MDVKRLLISFLIGLGPLASTMAFFAITSRNAVGANIGGGLILLPVLIITPFLLIAAGAYYFRSR